MNKLLQVYGKNTDAQEIVQAELTSAFPTLVDQFNMVERIYEKFYDWMFPFVYTEDGGASMTWRANVRSWIAKNPKLVELEAHFAQGTLSGTLTEQIDDTDDTTFTDNRATKQSTTFKGVDTTGSGALADSVTNEFETGKNTTENARTYRRTRIYADGRNWVLVMNDVQKADEPVYTFINSFARLLVSPTWCKQDFCEVLPPSVEMSVQVEGLPTGSEPTAEIVNRGTPFNADWLLSLDIPQGPQGEPGETGPQGPQGEPGPDGTEGRSSLIYTSTFTEAWPPVVSEAPYALSTSSFSRTPVAGDYFLMNYKDSSSGGTYIVIGEVVSISGSITLIKTVSFIETTGEQGPAGPQGPAGATKYSHNISILTSSNTAISLNLVNNDSTSYSGTDLSKLTSAILSAAGAKAKTRFIPANGWFDKTTEVIGIYVQQMGSRDGLMCITSNNSGLTLGAMAVYDTIT